MTDFGSQYWRQSVAENAEDRAWPMMPKAYGHAKVDHDQQDQASIAYDVAWLRLEVSYETDDRSCLTMSPADYNQGPQQQSKVDDE